MAKEALDGLSTTLKRASANIAQAGKDNVALAKDALGIVDPIPYDIYYDAENIAFVKDSPEHPELEGVMSQLFFEKWHPRWAEFPLYNPPAESGEHTVDSTIPDVVDGEALAATVYDFAHLGQPTEFTDRRKTRLRDDMEEIKAEVEKIDAEIAYLNDRRTDAMRAFSGISADLQAMEK